MVSAILSPEREAALISFKQRTVQLATSLLRKMKELTRHLFAIALCQ